METVYFSLPGNEMLTEVLILKGGAILGSVVVRNFPDGETYIRVNADVKNKKVVLVCTLSKPNEKIIPLYLLAKTLKSQGVSSITLLAPYLAYMRQDKIFQNGESLSSAYFGAFLSSFLDEIITIDPHLHRLHDMKSTYTIPVKVRHASTYVAAWIKANIKNPIIIGPDAESEQWVREIAELANAHYLVLEKIRYGDHDVKVALKGNPDLKSRTPVLVDDIISTGITMIETVKMIVEAGAEKPVCIAIHAIFAGNAYEDLKSAGAQTIVSCNTINHFSNEIDVTDLMLIE